MAELGAIYEKGKAYEINFCSAIYEEAKAVEKVCDAIMDKKVNTPDDVQIVRHGKWIKFIDNGIEYQTCSECNYDMPVGGADSWCPACGRRMDGD